MNLQFAGGIMLLSNVGDKLQMMIEDVHQESIKVGVKTNQLQTTIIYTQ